MLTLYARDGNDIVKLDNEALHDRMADIIWVDLNLPTDEEEKLVEKTFAIDIPTQNEMAALELSNRLYREKDAYFLTITIITHAESTEPQNKPYTFVLTKDRLVTVRYADTQPFKIVTGRLLSARYTPDLSPPSLALSLFEAIVNRLADVLEISDRKIDTISRHIFRSSGIKSLQGSTSKNNLDYFVSIRETGIEGDILSKVKESLISLSRLISFFKQMSFDAQDADQRHRVDTLSMDVSALNDHAGFLSNKITFLLDATLGMIGIQQNAIIKIFSIAAVIFLPPTLVASIYGMNFKDMPELNWVYGYPMALIIMVLAAYLPYRFFQYKKWL